MPEGLGIIVAGVAATLLVSSMLAKIAHNMKCNEWNNNNDIYQNALKNATNDYDRDYANRLLKPGEKPAGCGCTGGK
jgi:hypothetical protein